MPEVSVVIPTFNRPTLLAGAIDTALAQTFDEVEVVVVDDGSETAYARSTVDEFPSNVRCLEHGTNRGLSAARNTGIGATDSEYVAFLDDDDRWHESKLARQVRALEVRPEAGLATCCVAAVTPEGTPLRCEGSKPDGALARRILVRNVVGSPSRILVKRDCFEDVGLFDEDLPTKQDWDFYIRACQDWNVVSIDEPLVYRTVHESMSTGRQAAEEDNYRVIEKHRDRIERAGLLDRTMAGYYANVGRTHLENGDFGPARRWLWRAVVRDFGPWYLALLATALAGRRAFGASLALKRTIERSKNCPEWLDPPAVTREPGDG